jgi:hypothetical protein
MRIGIQSTSTQRPSCIDCTAQQRLVSPTRYSWLSVRTKTLAWLAEYSSRCSRNEFRVRSSKLRCVPKVDCLDGVWIAGAIPHWQANLKKDSTCTCTPAYSDRSCFLERGYEEGAIMLFSFVLFDVFRIPIFRCYAFTYVRKERPPTRPPIS